MKLACYEILKYLNLPSCDLSGIFKIDGGVSFRIIKVNQYSGLILKYFIYFDEKT